MLLPVKTRIYPDIIFRMIDILFRSVSETLLQFGENPENGFGGKLGFMTFLHTWDLKILDHFHIHCIIPAGAFTKGEKFKSPFYNKRGIYNGKYFIEWECGADLSADTIEARWDTMPIKNAQQES